MSLHSVVLKYGFLNRILSITNNILSSEKSMVGKYLEHRDIAPNFLTNTRDYFPLKWYFPNPFQILC